LDIYLYILLPAHSFEYLVKFKFALSFYHAEQEIASLDGLGVSVFLWCKVKDNSFLFILLAGCSWLFV